MFQAGLLRAKRLASGVCVNAAWKGITDYLTAVREFQTNQFVSDENLEFFANQGKPKHFASVMGRL